jgi:fimbrial isopeptide formation D2 family protein
VVSGATVYYTSADPATLSDDPGDSSNGTAGGPVSARWSTTFTPNATAIRVIGPALAPGAEQQFTVPITTDGAKGGDKLVNRAQARAGHTELVMRTSAPITVANYYSATLKKYVQDNAGIWHDANDAADYPTFHYGDKIHYKVLVTNTGQGTLTNIDVADDKQPTLGAFHIASLAPGDSQSHEYSIVLDKSVSGTVVNTASATADTPPDATTPPTIPSDPAGFDVANYVTTKASDPASGTAVKPGQTIKYTIKVTQQGSAPADATFSDDLAKVLDDADYNADVTADIGTVHFDAAAKTIAWTGTVPVGGVATVTYSVTVHDVVGLNAGGDQDLFNPVTSPGCVDAASCSTDNKVSWFTYDKIADPKSGNSVGVGESIKYTIKVTQHGAAAYPNASVVDDLSDVLDDATYGKDAKASDGTVTFKSPTLNWSGDLAVGQTATITYTVTVTGRGSQELVNPVTSTDKGGYCDKSVGCRTDHLVGGYVYSKTADPASGSTVRVGQKITYTVTITQTGKGAVANASVNDDMAKVLDDATYDKDAKASAGTISYKAPHLTWTGNLAVGAKVTITYSVTVNGDGDGHLANVVSSPTDDGRRAHCDTSVGCRTEHDLSKGGGTGTGGNDAGGRTAITGSNLALPLILGSLLVGVGGLLTLSTMRRRSRRALRA